MQSASQPFLRPDGLTRLLKSLTELRFEDERPEITVIVVNNDADDERPGEICDHIGETAPYRIEYIVEPSRGISFARNNALDCAVRSNHPLIAFLYDDEVVEPDWLAELLRVLDESDADVVTGPVEPEFLLPPPAVENEPLISRRAACERGNNAQLRKTCPHLARTRAGSSSART